MLWIGLDEAGYGPPLGPLVIGATMWRVPDELILGKKRLKENHLLPPHRKSRRKKQRLKIRATLLLPLIVHLPSQLAVFIIICAIL